LTWVPKASAVSVEVSSATALTFNSQAPYSSARRAELDNQAVAFAESYTSANASTPGDTTLKTAAISWKVQYRDTGLDVSALADTAKFLPEMETADVEIPAINHLLGATGPSLSIRLHESYLLHGFRAADGAGPLANPGEVFAALVGKGDLRFPVERSGGLARPDMQFDGLSRLVGPVSNAAALAAGAFDPAQVFAATEATLLGGVKLSEIIQPFSRLDPAEVRNTMAQVQNLPDIHLDDLGPMRVPLLMSRPIYTPGTDMTAIPPPEPVAVETHMLWKPDLATTSILVPKQGGDMRLALHTRLVQQLASGETSYRVDGRLRDFAIDFAGVMSVSFDALTFVAEQGRKLDVSAEGVDVRFAGPLTFVNELRKILPANGWSDPPALAVSPEGVSSNYSLGLPSVGIGIFSLQNVSLSATLSIPFVSQPAGVRFAISERQSPFLVTVGIFGGGGFFSLVLSTSGIEQIEASIEFGGNISLNLGVASGGVYIMAGIYFNMVGSDVKLTGYLRCGGALEVLGLVSISVEFYMRLTYDLAADKVTGQATLTVCIEIAFFSKSVHLSIERKFGGSSGDPTFEDLVDEMAWMEYCDAFAA
jgi:hypothetical protein